MLQAVSTGGRIIEAAHIVVVAVAAEHMSTLPCFSLARGTTGHTPKDCRVSGSLMFDGFINSSVQLQLFDDVAMRGTYVMGNGLLVDVMFPGPPDQTFPVRWVALDDPFPGLKILSGRRER